MKNVPYVKTYKNGILMNPIEKVYLSPFPNGQQRRDFLKRVKTSTIRSVPEYNPLIKAEKIGGIFQNAVKNIKEASASIWDKLTKDSRFLGTASMFKGRDLWAIDPETMEIYQVNIEENTQNLKTGSEYMAEVNPKHPIAWAINLTNARRKLIN